MAKSKATDLLASHKKIQTTLSTPFNVGVIALTPQKSNVVYNRRDYYKISLITKGSSNIIYPTRGLHVDRPALIFANPRIPFAWENTSEDITGYYCVFKDSFFRDKERREVFRDFPLFKAGGDPVFFLNDDQLPYLVSLFERMKVELETDYVYKYDVLRSSLHLVIHEALKMQPANNYIPNVNAANRIANLFVELLDRQFPVDSPQFIFQLKKPADFAANMAIHVNHLNAAVSEVTGKNTTTHINEKVMAEAKALLKHTDWPVADIGYSLGFEYPSYFNIFFKKHEGATPLAFRKTL
ncbi:Helix-turn-helix domain-containing protein [Filimonas lacunae]|uniref:Helix-turn-helix domain-containing protein n=1 Tax=Filimonas lacunae TaxID=477680 RepID=A0A173MKT9_9BACT|nr:AraC family transcriptional regulator [Filimonas lacunae]BAV08262.1 transcriptional regulator, AraC family [Filimonas lacunae]SIT33195.1 Helix-turn-helix domain-containing protein [Filimonas lacunae]